MRVTLKLTLCGLLAAVSVATADGIIQSVRSGVTHGASPAPQGWNDPNASITRFTFEPTATNSYGLVIDSGAYLHHGTGVGWTWTIIGTNTVAGVNAGRVEHGGSFDGIDDEIKYPSSTGTSDYSVVVWICPSSLPAHGTIWSERDASLNVRGISMLFGLLRFELIPGSLTGEISPSVTTGVWQHIAVSCSNNLAYCYTNGLLSSVLPATNSWTPNTGSVAGCWGISQPYPGLVDDLTIYSKALTATEILAHYNNTAKNGSHPNGQDQNATDTAVASSGSVTTDGLYRVHTYLSNGVYNCASATTVDMLIVAGGGGGGSGGGGGGGVVVTNLSLGKGDHWVSVGLGGAPRTVGNNTSVDAVYMARGGGKGGQADIAVGGTGGSGGGGGACSTGVTGGGTNVVGQGSLGGGNGNYRGSPYPAGGGGGAAQVGGSATANNQGGIGGEGITNAYSGVAMVYGSGGGGACFVGGGTGGTGGTGAGNGASGTLGGDATANRGGGGGGGGLDTPSGGNGGSGGSGIVIIRELK